MNLYLITNSSILFYRTSFEDGVFTYRIIAKGQGHDLLHKPILSSSHLSTFNLGLCKVHIEHNGLGLDDSLFNNICRLSPLKQKITGHFEQHMFIVNYYGVQVAIELFGFDKQTVYGTLQRFKVDDNLYEFDGIDKPSINTNLQFVCNLFKEILNVL